MIIKNEKELTIGDYVLDMDNDKGQIVNISIDGAGRVWAEVLYEERPRYYHKWCVEELKLFNKLIAQISIVRIELHALADSIMSKTPIDYISLEAIKEMDDQLHVVKIRTSKAIS